MKKMMAVGVITLGMLGSLIGGMAVGAHAAETIWTFASTILIGQASEQFQRGYVAGVNDAIQTAADGDENIANEAACIKARATTVSQLLAWAKWQWLTSLNKYPDGVNAASTLLAACDGEAQ